jgi:arylsulfatase
VDDRDYKVPFQFTGKLNKVTFRLGPVRLTDVDRRTMHAHIIRARD